MAAPTRLTVGQMRVLRAMVKGAMLYRRSLNHRGWRLQNFRGALVQKFVQQRTAEPLFAAGLIAYVGANMHDQAEITKAGRLRAEGNK